MLLKRFEGNPILKPIAEHPWESLAVFNPAAVYEGGKIHIVYRALAQDLTSVLGYASSSDGFRIDERLPEPIYQPRKDFEKRVQPGYSGCEDPRITKLGDKFYMCYTAYDACHLPKVALSSIKVKNFLNKNWDWSEPELISPPKTADKNACIFGEKRLGKYVFFHRMQHQIWLDFVDSLNFPQEICLTGKIWMRVRKKSWDSEKIGIGGPPIKTKDGWLLIYHGMSEVDKKYRLGAVLLDLENPAKLISRLKDPILEPETDYEYQGVRPGTVFTCGAVILDGQLLVYYGAGDSTIGVATAKLDELLKELKAEQKLK